MTEPPRLSLRVRRTDAAIVESLAGEFPRIGFRGLLDGAAGRGRRGRWTRVPAAAAIEGFRWQRRDARDRVWWPQGIDMRVEADGTRVLAVSGYAHPHRRVRGGARISFVVLRPGAPPRYRHVALVEAVPDADARGGVGMRPVLVHAGGIAWHGDRLLVAATFGGIRVFELRDILRTTAPRWGGLLGRKGVGPFGSRAVLPQREHWDAASSSADRARYSFLSLEHGAPARIVAGEYLRDEPVGRLLRVPLPVDDEAEVDEVHVPGLMRMQGAAVVDDVWFVATSEGFRAGGDLWVGTPEALTRHRGVLAPGPEDLAREPGSRRLWTLSERPGRRWVYRIDADDWIR